MNLTTIIMQTLNGLTIAAIYILLSTGLTIILGLQGIINVAHGLFYMLGAYIGLSLMTKAAFSFWLALPVALVATFLLGAAFELSGVRTLTRWKRGQIHQVILTLGFAIFGTEVVKFIWGPEPQIANVPATFKGVLVLGPVIYPKYWFFVMVFAVAIMLGLLFFFKWTGLGILVRSLDSNREVSESLGTNGPLLTTIIFGLGTGIAGVAGVLAGPILSVDTNMGIELLMILFVVIIMGGLGSLMGTVVSGVIIGLIIAFGSALSSGMIARILVFVAMIIILIVRPSGLLGRGIDVE